MDTIHMKTEYSRTDNGYICYYQSKDFEAVIPTDRNDPHTPGMGTVTPLGATGFGTTKQAAYNIAKHNFKIQFQQGTAYRPKGDLSKILDMPAIWDWSSSAGRDVVFVFEVHHPVVYGQMRKFSKHPKIEDWVVVNRRFEGVSPRRAKQVLRSAMRERIEFLKKEETRPKAPVSFSHIGG
jgi:hypothetical protein